MIEKNLGNTERLLRFVTGLALLVWAWRQPALAPLEWLLVLAAVFLLLNGIFSRCYLWHVLKLNSCKSAEPGQSTGRDKSTPS